MTRAQEQDIAQQVEHVSASGQYLTLMLAGEEYGVLNLRGTVVPIIDLRKRFNLNSIAYGSTTVVIVVRMLDDDKERTMCLVVDAVAELIDFRMIQIAMTEEPLH